MITTIENQRRLKKRRQIRFMLFGAGVCILVAAVFVIVAIVFRRMEDENYPSSIPTPMFAIAAVFVIGSMLLFFFYFKLTKSSWNSDYLMLSRLKNYTDYKSKNPLLEFEVREEFFEKKEEFFSEYSCRELYYGKLYYTLAHNDLNVTMPLVSGFLVTNRHFFHNFEIEPSKKKIAEVAKDTEEFLLKEFDGLKFINCVIITLHDALEQSHIEFFHNFVGLRKTDSSNAARWATQRGRIITANIQHNFLAIDSESKKGYFFYSLKDDTGDEANLEELIANEILVEPEATEPEVDSEPKEIEPEVIE